MVALSIPIITVKYWFYDSYILGIDDYISDEQWYVAASINIFRELFNISLISKYNTSYYQYTVFLRDNCSFRDVIVELSGKGIHAIPIEKRSFTKINAVTIATNKRINNSIINQSTCIEDFMPGIAPNEANINTYLNMEHPPLVKYILGVSMYFLGVDSYGWRIPSIITGYLIIVILVFMAYEYSRLNKDDKWLIFILSYLVLFAGILYDKLFLSLTSISLLDIYVLFFTLLALYAAIKRKYLLAAVLVGLAGSSKMTGFFAIPWLYIAMRIDGQKVGKSFAYSLIVPMIVYLAINVPLMATYGLEKWFNELYGAIKWHTSSRPPGPPSTNPLGLILTLNPFPLYYIDGVLFLVAHCNPGICLYGITLSLLSTALLLDTCYPSRHNGDADATIPYLLKLGILVLSIWAGYWAVYAAGNHTLYTFYSIQLQPLLLLLVAASIAHYKFLLVKPASIIPALGLKRIISIIRDFCAEKYSEFHPLIALSRAPIPAKLAITYITYIMVLLAYLALTGFIHPSNTFLVKPCIHHYGFNPIDSFICLYTDKTVTIVLVAVSIILWSDYIYRNHRDDEILVRSLIVGFPLFIASLFQSVALLLLPLFLSYLFRRENSFYYGFLMGIISPSPLFAGIAFSEPRTLAGFIAGFAASQVFMFSQEGIDYSLQLAYLSVYSLLAAIIILFARLHARRLSIEKTLPIVVSLISTLSMPCGLLLIIYSIYFIVSRKGVLRAALIAGIIGIIEFYYPYFPPLPVVQSSFYIAIGVSALLGWIGVKSASSVQRDSINIPAEN